MNDSKFYYNFYYPKLDKFHYFILIGNKIYFIIAFVYVIISFIRSINGKTADMINPHYFWILYTSLIIINLLGILYCHYTDGLYWDNKNVCIIYKLFHKQSYPWFGSNSNILRFCYTIAIIGNLLPLIHFGTLSFYLFFMRPFSLMFMLSSWAFSYYVTHPIYKDGQLSLINLIRMPKINISARWINGISSIMIFIMYILIIFSVIIQFIVYIISVSGAGKVNVKRFKHINGKKQPLSKAAVLLKSNKESLSKLRPSLNNVCCFLLAFLLILLLIRLIYIITKSFIYSIVNDITTYRLIWFITELLYYILRFAIVTISSIIILNRMIQYFEEHTLSLNIFSAIAILFFFPIMEIFYLIYTFNSMNKVKC